MPATEPNFVCGQCGEECPTVLVNHALCDRCFNSWHRGAKENSFIPGEYARPVFPADAFAVGPSQPPPEPLQCCGVLGDSRCSCGHFTCSSCLSLAEVP
jgi:hypothetical protein